MAFSAGPSGASEGVRERKKGGAEGDVPLEERQAE